MTIIMGFKNENTKISTFALLPRIPPNVPTYLCFVLIFLIPWFLSFLMVLRIIGYLVQCNHLNLRI